MVGATLGMPGGTGALGCSVGKAVFGLPVGPTDGAILSVDTAVFAGATVGFGTDGAEKASDGLLLGTLVAG